MNSELIKLLADLANKLGTTTERLWSCLLRQAPIEGIIYLIVWVVYGVVLWRVFKWVKEFPKSDWNDAFLDNLPMVIFICVVISSLVIFGAALPMIVAALFNPEYWALKQIIK